MWHDLELPGHRFSMRDCLYYLWACLWEIVLIKWCWKPSPPWSVPFLKQMLSCKTCGEIQLRPWVRMRSFHSTLDCECDVVRRLPHHDRLGTGTVSYNKLSLSDFLSGHFISASDMKLETLGRWPLWGLSLDMVLSKFGCWNLIVGNGRASVNAEALPSWCRSWLYNRGRRDLMCSCPCQENCVTRPQTVNLLALSSYFPNCVRK